MFDVKAEAREFVGETRDEALAQAVEFFGVSESELTVGELDVTEVSGLGARALVVAIPTSARGRSAGRRREGGDDGEGRESRGRRERRDRGDRGERGDRGDRGDRGGRGDRGERSDRGRRGGRGRSDSAAAETARIPSAEESKGSAKGELGPVGEFVRGAIERMRLGSFEISENLDGEFRVIEVGGDAAAGLAGGEGRASDALQLLANQFAIHEEDNAARVVLDVEGDSERRETALGRLAERAAKRALDTGRTVALDPMNARDRRLVHVALRDSEGIATISSGEGRYRQVLVAPEGTPEFEEALESED